MKEAIPPSNEPRRIAALKKLDILDTPAEERFDRITRLARRALDTPIALISLVDDDRQWFKSVQGLDAIETERAISFCGHAIHSDEVFVVADAGQDERFHDNPLVTGGPRIRFYAGRPIRSPDNHLIGTMCVIDSKPRSLHAVDLRSLDDLASLVEAELAMQVLSQTEQELRSRLSEAERRASTDSLTRLWNRETMMQILDAEIGRSSRNSTDVGLLLVDLDHFKKVNDRHGHHVGDRALMQSAESMRRAVRTYDSVGRYGGEEFIAVLPECDLDEAMIIAGRLCRSIRSVPVETDDGTITLTASVGAVARSTDDDLGPQALVNAADKALYKAKTTGRDRVVAGP